MKTSYELTEYELITLCEASYEKGQKHPENSVWRRKIIAQNIVRRYLETRGIEEYDEPNVCECSGCSKYCKKNRLCDKLIIKPDGARVYRLVSPTSPACEEYEPKIEKQ